MDLDTFLSSEYRMEIFEVEESDSEESGYVITCPELPGIKVFGESLKEAFAELREAKIAWFEMKQELGEEIPKPMK